MNIKSWEIREAVVQDAETIKDELSVSSFLAGVLAARGYNAGDARMLTGEAPLEDPFVLKGMNEAVARIHRAIEDGEQVVVFGDYDCDGITAAALLTQYLSSAGADVTPYIPERDRDGYGINRGAIDVIAAQGTGLIITVDNGIVAFDEAEYCREKDIDLIITDHHTPQDVLPDCIAVINPHRTDCESSYKDLSGVGVALKLAAALEGGDYDTALDYFAEFAAIGTIADVVPLTGENRTIVKYGLSMLSMTQHQGIAALLAVSGLSGKPVTAAAVGFSLAPRINAAGRFSKAGLAYALLSAEDEEEARSLAEQLQEVNVLRQEKEQDILKEAEQMMSDDPKKRYGRVLVLWGEGWHEGVVGVAAARLADKYGKPCILFSAGETEAVGSARSAGDFSIYDAIFSAKDLCVKFGGHKAAAGMTLNRSDLDEFARRINEYAKEHYDIMPPVTITADCELSVKDITAENVQSLDILAPFGVENPPPVFLLKEARVADIIPLSGGKHCKAVLQKDGQRITLICFGTQPQSFGYRAGESIDVMVSMELNNYNGSTSVSVRMLSCRPSGFQEDRFFSAKAAFEAVMRGEKVDERLRERIVPTREEIGKVFTLLKKTGVFFGDEELLYTRFWKTSLSFCKLCLILHILRELSLLEISSGQIFVMPVTRKTELESSELFMRLQQ